MSTETPVSEVAPVETPIIPDPITPDVVTAPEIPAKTPTTPETPVSAEEASLSDEEVDAAIEAILKDMPSTVVTEPTFFP